jgi:4-hydroxy-4-methyl-2-oxoglutarate aldolase
MEKHQLHGLVVAEIERPPADHITAFERHDTAKVADGMGRYGVMRAEIKPILAGMRVLGPAVTVLTRPGDALYVAHAADVAQPGDVIVIDAGGFSDVAVIGERIVYYMQTKRGIAGLVIDGAVRDRRGLRELGLPIFCSGVTPLIFGSQGPGAINVPISCGGVPVNPGDIVLGDDDGVVVVPRQDAQRVAELADAHLAGELERVGEMDRGMSLTDVQNLSPRLDAWNHD